MREPGQQQDWPELAENSIVPDQPQRIRESHKVVDAYEFRQIKEQGGIENGDPEVCGCTKCTYEERCAPQPEFQNLSRIHDFNPARRVHE
mmetsp:Transcript_17357/g.39167  ORF Transcript_17357/g.39167 Transcript_17357/m.39167 type:complete len:90 (+) Transcript_17357:1467-1736(+)